MRVDPIDQLRRENPVPDPLPAPPIEPLLLRIDEEPAIVPFLTRRLADLDRRPRPNAGGLVTALVVAVTLVIGGGG